MADRILQTLSGEALDDDMLTARLGVVHQQVNATCRRLEAEGRIIRFQPTGDKILNRLAAGAPAPPRAAPPVRTPPAGRLSEDLVKQTLNE